MPLLKGKSKKTISANIDELMRSTPGSAREKGIHTMMKKHKGMTYNQAKQKMAIAISYSKSKK
jgi:hypothetical protein